MHKTWQEPRGWGVAVLALVAGLSGCANCGGTTPGSGGDDDDTGSTGQPDGSVVVASSSGPASGESGSSGAVSGSGSSTSSSGSGSLTSSSGPAASSGAGSSSTEASSGVSGGSSSSSAASAPTVVISQPANNGTETRDPILISASVTFVADITATVPVTASQVSWTVTEPGASPVTSPGTLTGAQASLSLLMSTAGAWTLTISVDDGVHPPASATLLARVYSNLPPRLQWMAPANDGTAVASPRVLGTQLAFQASLSDDGALQPLSVLWTHTRPDNSQVTSQGTHVPLSGTSAREEYTADLSSAGTHRVRLDYTDGSTPVFLELSVAVMADLPPVLSFTAPANNGTAVTDPIAVGDTPTFRVSLTDDATIVPANGHFTITPPGGVGADQPGTVVPNGRSATASLAVNFSSAGAWTVAFSYTDAASNVVTRSLQVPVSQDPAPVVRVTQPANNGTLVTASVREHQALTLVGSISDNAAINPLRVGWTFTPAGGTPQQSQGQIAGSGTSITSSFAIADVGTAGPASLALSYTDASGNTATATLQVPVLSLTAPVLRITEPANNGITLDNPARLGAVITFRASVTDDVAIDAAKLRWTVTSPGGAADQSPGSFAPGGTVGTGTASLAASLVAEGEWTISLQYADASNQTAQSSVKATVVGNRAPTCTWEAPQACLGPGQHTFALVLEDLDGDTPVTATLGSSVNQDQLPGSTSGSGTRHVQVTLSGTGTHTLTCTPTDSTGLAGAPATLAVVVAAAPTVSLDAPVDGARVAAGNNVDVQVSSTVDPGAVPGTLSVLDSMSGSVALDATGHGVVSAPALGLHDLRAEVQDACNATATDGPVRYAVTPGGGALSTLGQTTTLGAGVNVYDIVTDTDGSLLVATANGLRRVDPVTGTATAYNPNTSGGGDNLPANQGIRAIALGGTSNGTRLEIYGSTGAGAWMCLRSAGGTQCVNWTRDAGLVADDVRDVLVLGSGQGAVLVVLGTQGLQMLSADGQVLVEMQRGNGNSNFPGDGRGLVAVDNGTQRQFWVFTSAGAVLVTLQQGNQPQFTHVDAQATPGALPSFDIRDLAVDPASADVQWFATAGGLTQHTGPSFAPNSFQDIRDTQAGAPPTDLSAVEVDRWPDAAKPILWVGTNQAGFYRLDVSSSPPLMTRVRAADGVGLPSDRIRTISVDRPSATSHPKWMGTDQGLWAYLGQ